MPGFPAAARPYRHTAVALLLCLLTLSCAMEAKFAWYQPPAGPTIDARSTKAIPADTRESSTDDSANADAACAGIFCFLFVFFAAIWLLGAGLSKERLLAPPVRPALS